MPFSSFFLTRGGSTKFPTSRPAPNFQRAAVPFPLVFYDCRAPRPEHPGQSPHNACSLGPGAPPRRLAAPAEGHAPVRFLLRHHDAHTRAARAQARRLAAAESHAPAESRRRHALATSRPRKPPVPASIPQVDTAAVGTTHSAANPSSVYHPSLSLFLF